MFVRRGRRVVSPGPSNTTTRVLSLLKVTVLGFLLGLLMVVPLVVRPKTCAAPPSRHQRAKWPRKGLGLETNNRECGKRPEPPPDDPGSATVAGGSILPHPSPVVHFRPRKTENSGLDLPLRFGVYVGAPCSGVVGLQANW